MNRNAKYWLSVYIIVTNFCVNFLGYINVVSTIKYLTFLLINLLLMFISKTFFKIKVKSEIMLISVYFAYLCVLTLLNGYSIYNCQTVVQMLTALWLIKYIIEKDLKDILHAAYDVSVLVLPINLFICVLFPDGLFRADNGIGVYLLGNKNAMGQIISTFIVLDLLYSYATYRILRIKIFFPIACGLATIIYTWAVTSLICVAIILIYIYIPHNSFVRKTFNRMSVWALFLCGVLAFVLLSYFNIQDLFITVFNSILHKSMNLSGRTIVWESAANAISVSPLFGHGLYDAAVLRNAYFSPANAHSLYFEVPLLSGVVGILFVLKMLKRFSLNLKLIQDDLVKGFLKLYFFLMLVEGLVESINMNIVFYILFIMSDAYALHLSPYRKDVLMN